MQYISFLYLSHDTIFIKFPGSEYLTQRSGTSGAHNFMATTTYTLTELKGMKYVDFEFEEGDHARPGTYERLDFESR